MIGNFPSLFIVATGGFLGALARYGIVTWCKTRTTRLSPYAILLINLSGSFALGLLFGLNHDRQAYLLLGVGFMGAYTTFSTFNIDNIELWRQKKWVPLSIHLLGSYLLGPLLAFAGYWLSFRI